VTGGDEDVVADHPRGAGAARHTDAALAPVTGWHAIVRAVAYGLHPSALPPRQDVGHDDARRGLPREMSSAARRRRRVADELDGHGVAVEHGAVPVGGVGEGVGVELLLERSAPQDQCRVRRQAGPVEVQLYPRRAGVGHDGQVRRVLRVSGIVRVGDEGLAQWRDRQLWDLILGGHQQRGWEIGSQCEEAEDAADAIDAFHCFRLHL